ncbi:uncharacterized protein PAF06_017819 [Gastrophryne carolinensis]
MHKNFPLCFRLWLCLLGELKLYEAYIQRPSIIFSASYTTYLTGEPVTLNCQASVDFTIHGYKFFKNNREVRTERSSVSKYRISSVKRGDAGSYSCLYWVSDSRGKRESEVSLPVSLAVMDQPSTPVLNVIPKQLLYFEGESVTLECQHSSITSQVHYQFQKDSSKLKNYHDSLMPQYHIEDLRTMDSGLYDCQYWVSGHQRTFYSLKSIPEAITVTALSSAPLLNFEPSYTTFIKGENVSMECVAPTPVHVTVYRLYKDGEEITGKSAYRGFYTLHNITQKDQAEYTCMYWSPKMNREIPSAQSKARDIYVIDPIRPPFLSADPPSGRIRDGSNLTLYCIIQEHFERVTFYFLNETDEIASVSAYKSQTRAAVIVINIRKNNNTSPKKYSCQYTAEIKGRSLLSPESPQIEITVITSGSLLWLIAIGVATGVIVLIIIISLVYWVLAGKKDTDKDKEQQENTPKSEPQTNKGVESSFKKDISDLQNSVTGLDSKVSSLEQSHLSTIQRIEALENGLAVQRSISQVAVLHLDDLENRSRRNNIRLRGLPESADPNRPWDVICRLHYYSVKEEILRKAWERDRICFDGATIQIFPDVSRRSLHMRGLLRPLLAKILECGASYRWGYPFHLLVRKNQWSCALRSPEDLPELFAFLETVPIAVPDWLDPSPFTTPIRGGGGLPQRSRQARGGNAACRRNARRPPGTPVSGKTRLDPAQALKLPRYPLLS